MSDKKQELWKVHVIVKPVIEWEKMGVDTFRISKKEAITLEEQLENSTKLCFTVLSNSAEVHSRAEVLAKAFLACLELEAQRGYRFSVGSMEPVKPRTRENGWLLVAEFSLEAIRVVPRFEDLDLAFLKELSSSLIMLPIEKRNRILGALEFLYDGLAAHTPQQCFLSIYGGLNYLIAGEMQGKKKKKPGKTTRREDLMMVSLAEKGILQLADVKKWIEDVDHLHTVHYSVLKGKEFSQNELDKIKRLFREFLTKYIEYVKKVDKKSDGISVADRGIDEA